MRRTTIAALTALLMVLAPTAAYAHDDQATTDHSTMDHATTDNAMGKSQTPWRELRRVRRITSEYHWLPRALADGFAPFAIPEEVGGTLLSIRGEDITCFDSASGGMGVHYVRNIDATLDANDPEALVYEVGKNGRLSMVAVEYIVPEGFVDPANPPMLFGQMLHHHPYLPVYILHAWIWKWNPDGMFADFNPRVKPCPAG